MVNTAGNSKIAHEIEMIFIKVFYTLRLAGAFST